MSDRNCPVCGEDLIRLDKWDSSACRGCNIWTERVCLCGLCFAQKRPEKPNDEPDWDNPNNSLGYYTLGIKMLTSMDHDMALKEIETLWGAKPGTSERDKLEALAILVDAWERKYTPILPPEYNKNA
jgi:hypothetical protein